METAKQEDVSGTDAEEGLRWVAPGLADIYVDLWTVTTRRHLQRPGVLVAHGIREIMNVLARIVTYKERLKNRKPSPDEQVHQSMRGESGDALRGPDSSVSSIASDRRKPGAGKGLTGSQRTLYNDPSEADINELRCPHNGRKCVTYALKHEDHRVQVTKMYELIWGFRGGVQAMQSQVDEWISLHDEIMSVVHQNDGRVDENEPQFDRVLEWLTRLRDLLGSLFRSYMQDSEEIHALLDKANS